MLTNLVFCIIVTGMLYVSVTIRLNGLNRKLSEISREVDSTKEFLVKILKSEKPEQILKSQSELKKELEEVDGAIYGIYCNVELMSSMNMAAYVATTNETIRQLVKHDKFETAQILRKNLEKLLGDFNRINPNCKLEIKDANELIRGVFDRGDEEE